MNDDIVAALNAERYGPSTWWHKHTTDADEQAATDDTDLACARRRRAMEADFEKHTRKVV